MARKLEVSEFITKAVERNLVRHGIEQIRGGACFLPGRSVEIEKVGGERVIIVHGAGAFSLDQALYRHPVSHQESRLVQNLQPAYADPRQGSRDAPYATVQDRRVKSFT
jgi:hypothetical protein